jgi:hypothetical protein
MGQAVGGEKIDKSNQKDLSEEMGIEHDGG